MGDKSIMADVTYLLGLGGYDVSFNIASIASGQEVRVFSNSAFDSADFADANRRAYVGIKNNSGAYELYLRNTALAVLNFFPLTQTVSGLVRVIAHNEFVSVYVNRVWVHTWALSYVYHPENITVGIVLSTGTATVTDTLLRELSDWRENAWIEIDSTSMNAISSIINQRPIDIWSDYRGYMKFSYTYTRPTFNLEFVHRHVIDTADSAGSSDGILYGDAAAPVIDDSFLSDYGFVTRVYRLPDVETGPVRAINHYQELGRQRTKLHSTETRLFASLEIGDIASNIRTLSGTGTAIDEQFIVEELSINIDAGSNRMNIKGRDANL